MLVLIVPLWNWNKRSIAWTDTAVFSSNRTFMELKYEGAIKERGFNEKVLIVPLWNWNKTLSLAEWK